MLKKNKGNHYYMILNKIFSYIYPYKCIFCNVILSNDAYLEACDSCLDMIDFSKDKFPKSNFYPSQFCEGVFCLCTYEGLLRQAIIRFKFNEKDYYYRCFANLLVKIIEDYHNENPFDICLSVPMHKDRIKKRGYNQARLLSKEVANFLKIEEMSDFFIRDSYTQKQSLQKKESRKENLKASFKILDKEKFALKKILLVDDIVTTGTTIEACAKTLKETGAKAVYAAVIASARQ